MIWKNLPAYISLEDKYILTLGFLKVGRLGRWGWGFQDFLKYFIGDENVFFIFAAFYESPSPIAPFAPLLDFQIYICCF
jgi:hypothetical protein